MSESFFPQLFQTSQTITPYLHGDIGRIESDAIHIDNDINPIVQELYRQLSETYPEAGRRIGSQEHGICSAGSQSTLRLSLSTVFNRSRIWEILRSTYSPAL